MSDVMPEERAAQIMHIFENNIIERTVDHLPSWSYADIEAVKAEIAAAIREAEAQARRDERLRWYEWCNQARSTWDEKLYEAMDYEEHEDEDIRQHAQRQRQFWEGALHALHCAIVSNARDLLDAETARYTRWISDWAEESCAENTE